MTSTTGTAEIYQQHQDPKIFQTVLLKPRLRLGRTLKGRLTSSTGTFKREEEKDATQEISNPQDVKLQKIANSDGDDPNPVVQKDDKKN